MTDRLRGADRRAASPTSCALRSSSLLRQRGVELDIVVVGNGWEPDGSARRRARRRTCRWTTGIPAGRNAGVRARRAASCCSSSTTTRASPTTDALARVAGAVRRRPGARPACSSGRSARRRRAAARLGAAAARRRPHARGDVTGVWEGAVGDPARRLRRGRRLAGGVPLRARGHRPRLARDGRGLPRRVRRRDRGRCTRNRRAPPHAYSSTTGRATGCGSRAGTCRCRSASLYVASSPLRRVAALRTGRARREALRGYRDGVREPCGTRRPLRARTLWRMTRAGRPPDHVSTLDRPPMSTGATVRAEARTHARNDVGARQHARLRAVPVGLPPVRPYLREVWRRREFALELSRTKLRAQHFDTAFGQLWLVLNPLLLACVYFMLVDIIRGGSRRPGLLRPPGRRASSPTTSSPARSATARSRSSAAAG